MTVRDEKLSSGSYPIPFIVGSGRCGTSLLSMMLDSHPDLVMPPETHFIPLVADACEATADPHRVFVDSVTGLDRWPDFAMNPRELTEVINTIRPFDLRSAVCAFYELYARKFAKPRWGDQTAGYAISVDLLVQLFPEAHFIHVIRDGRDVALSFLDVWFGPATIEEAAHHWVKAVVAARRASQYPHYLEIRYEELVLDTENALRRVCQFIDLPWVPAMLDYHVHAAERIAILAHDMRGRAGVPKTTPAERLRPHLKVTERPDKSRVFNWKRRMSIDDRAKFEAIAGWMLRSLGYPMEESEDYPQPGPEADPISDLLVSYELRILDYEHQIHLLNRKLGVFSQRRSFRWLRAFWKWKERLRQLF